MLHTVLSGKIHRATVTDANLNYVGSVTIDSDLLDLAGIHAGEQVDIVDISNGARLTTYAIRGRAGSGCLEINGAAAHHVHPGDVVIVIAYVLCESAELARHEPNVVHVDHNNSAIMIGNDSSSAAPSVSYERSPGSMPAPSGTTASEFSGSIMQVRPAASIDQLIQEES
ncbi:aspartate 1-decarboxylase [Rhodococcus fascians]|nr:aspartate 1-decarboxylase [Rhodococcus fascians]MBY4058113.1 aspartate 1-decarboxylase [Rhodococcus fascians]MBY4069756.1 aspartate 1-decarboxylase [Rhodococcus fascians]